MSSWLKNKNIILAVSGGIAAYKSVELLRLIVKEGANVKVVMTKNSQKFVAPLTFEALSGQPVYSDSFESSDDTSIKHIQWAEQADAVIIAPATANIIGKLANGIADDALTTFMLAVTSHTILCPSMNSNMYESYPVQRNLDILEKDGYIILEPGTGELACGTAGPGRLPEPAIITDRLLNCLAPKDLKGKNVLVTAGPTQEPIDPVRFISNPSSGKMGFCIARASEQRGANVVLITGPNSLPDPINVKTVRIKTAKHMYKAVFEHLSTCDIIIKSAAVSDYRPQKQEKHKVKKNNDEIALVLQRNPDILKKIGQIKRDDQVVVGFAAETENLEQNAKIKLDEKNLDIIVGNIVGEDSSGFEADTNIVTFFYKDKPKESFELMEKNSVAHILLDRIVEKI